MNTKIYFRNPINKLIDNPALIIGYIRKVYFLLRGTDDYVDYFKKVKILDSEDTLDFLIKHNSSFARIGEGDVNIMNGGGVYYGDWFQKYDPVLKKRLGELFVPENKLLLGIPKTYLQMKRCQYDSFSFYFVWFETIYTLRRLVKLGKTYGNHLIFLNQNRTFDFKKLNLFLREKDVILVTGNVAPAKLGKTTTLIKTVSSNAWQIYDEIYSKVINTIKLKQFNKKDTLILLSIGTGSKVMVLDLTKQGYVAWDIGQFFELCYNEFISIA